MLLELLSRMVLLILHADTPYLFPQPLSQAEELACFEQMAAGDTKAKHKLIEHNLRLVVHIVKKYRNSSEEQEELVSIGTFGLMKAVDTFDYRKGARFSTYASRCVENAIHTGRTWMWNILLPLAAIGSMNEKSVNGSICFIPFRMDRHGVNHCTCSNSGFFKRDISPRSSVFSVNIPLRRH